MGNTEIWGDRVLDERWGSGAGGGGGGGGYREGGRQREKVEGVNGDVRQRGDRK